MDCFTESTKKRRRDEPNGLQRQVMFVNHESAFTEHLGAKKTEVRILPKFFRPGLRQDIILFCHLCDVCQRTVKRDSVKKGITRVYVKTLLKRVSVDLVIPVAP